jgi:predicted nucleic acid-binding protein
VKHFILDASVALAWFLDDPVPGYALRLKQSLLQGGHALVPPLWTLEVANGLAVGERRGNLVADQVDRGLALIEQLLAETIGISSATVPFRQILATARSLRLTAYHSAYLETARAEGLPLATLDKSLRHAASQIGAGLIH